MIYIMILVSLYVRNSSSIKHNQLNKISQYKLLNYTCAWRHIHPTQINNVNYTDKITKGTLGHPKGDFWLLSGFRLPNLPTFAWRATSQLKCFPRVSILHGGHSGKRQHLFKEKPHDDDEDRQRTLRFCYPVKKEHFNIIILNYRVRQ